MGTDILILDNLTLGKRARIMRLIRGLRQTDLAHIAHVSPLDVSYFERDWRISPRKRERILKALDIEATS